MEALISKRFIVSVGITIDSVLSAPDHAAETTVPPGNSQKFFLPRGIGETTIIGGDFELVKCGIPFPGECL